MKKNSFRKIFRIVWFSLVGLFMTWQFGTYQPRGIDKTLFQTDDEVKVINDEAKISFFHASAPKVNILFFPGGLVSSKSYTPLAYNLSRAGYNVHIIKMPWRMSTKGYNLIKELFDLDDPNRIFVLGGHSQGGKMAAQFVYENPSLISALFLMGTSHPRDYDMSHLAIPTLKVYAEHDGLASVGEVRQNQKLLPPNAQLSLIKGGNHTQFAYTGRLLMDGKATISRKEQQNQSLNVLLEYLDRVIGNN